MRHSLKQMFAALFNWYNLQIDRNLAFMKAPQWPTVFSHKFYCILSDVILSIQFCVCMCVMILLIFMFLQINKIDHIIEEGKKNINWMALCQKSQSYKVQVEQTYHVSNTNTRTTKLESKMSRENFQISKQWVYGIKTMMFCAIHIFCMYIWNDMFCFCCICRVKRHS